MQNCPISYSIKITALSWQRLYKAFQMDTNLPNEDGMCKIRKCECKESIFSRSLGNIICKHCTPIERTCIKGGVKNVCFTSMELTPSHTAGNMLHENPSLDSILHIQVFHQTNGCSDQKQLSLHPPHVGTVKNNNYLHHS